MKIFSFLELLVLCWKSSNIAPFMEHSVYIFFNVENVLNLACWFSFYTSCPSFMFKTYLFSNFWVLCERSIDIFLFGERSVYNIFKVQSARFRCCYFYFLTTYPNSMFKTFLLQKFLVFCQRSNNIDRAPKEVAWIFLVDFFFFFFHCLGGFYK